VTQEHFGVEKLRSEHLYQVYAYLTQLQDDAVAPSTEIMLLYPSVGRKVTATYIVEGRRLSVRTVDLNQDWPAVHRDLLSLVA
jgi:5-methylcytosine-specific restriction enzyme subunit McrC